MINNDSKKSSSYSPSNYLENPFYRRTPSNSKDDREFLQQALLPPSPLVQIPSHSRSYYSTPPQNHHSTNGGRNASSLASNAGLRTAGILPGRPRRRNPWKNSSSAQTHLRTVSNVTTASGRQKIAQGYTGLWRILGIFSSSQPTIEKRSPTSALIQNSTGGGQLPKHSNTELLTSNGNAKVLPTDNEASSVPKTKRRRHSYYRTVDANDPGVVSHKKSYLSCIRMVKLQLPAAVMMWYLLGVLSISTTKILLRDWESYGVSPLLLTVQQFCIGISFLRLWIQLHHRGPPQPITFRNIFSTSNRHQQTNSQIYNNNKSTHQHHPTSSNAELHLLLSSTCFTLGFLVTNQSFFNSDASFVETIKAAEPLSSATTAVLWGLEQISPMEVGSLLSISAGVILATLGDAQQPNSVATTVSLGQSMQSSGTVLLSNLFFSFRGLYQKLFRTSSIGSVVVIDDLNLQFRMQQLGILILIFPLVVFDGCPFVGNIIDRGGIKGLIGENNSMDGGMFIKYVGLALVNGFAFTHYNLASTYILTRISVVHHASLNCIRRLFAIIITSIIFGVQITLLSGLGIAISIAGFLAFTHYKMERVKTPRPLSSLLPLSE